MNQGQIETIPAALLYEFGTAGLREWLHTHGLRLSLLELNNERARRQGRTPTSQRSPRRANRRNDQ